MKYEAKISVGTKPKPEFVGNNGTMVLKFSGAENHAKNVGTQKDPEWENTGTSWFQFQVWGDLAKEMMNDGIGEGDFLEVKGVHKIKKYQKKNEKASYFPNYTIYEYEIIKRSDK